jgi:hypothetical protein
VGGAEALLGQAQRLKEACDAAGVRRHRLSPCELGCLCTGVPSPPLPVEDAVQVVALLCWASGAFSSCLRRSGTRVTAALFFAI